MINFEIIPKKLTQEFKDFQVNWLRRVLKISAFFKRLRRSLFW